MDPQHKKVLRQYADILANVSSNCFDIADKEDWLGKAKLTIYLQRAGRIVSGVGSGLAGLGDTLQTTMKPPQLKSQSLSKPDTVSVPGTAAINKVR